MMTRLDNGLFACLMGVIALCVAVPALASDVEDLEIPVFANDQGFKLGVAKYEATTKADLLDSKRGLAYRIELAGLLQAPAKLDVLCFRTQFTAKKAADRGGKDLLAGGKRGREKREYGGLLPVEGFPATGSKALLLAQSKLDEVELRRPAYEVDSLMLEVQAVVVAKKAQSDLPALVADEFIDIGYETEVMVKSMQVDRKGIMKIMLDVKRPAGERDPIIDSVFALDKDGKVLGGGRWVNEVDIFAADGEVELEFPLQNRKTATKLRVVLATKYRVQTVSFDVKKLFQK